MLNSIHPRIRGFVHAIPGRTALLTLAVVGVVFCAGCSSDGESGAPVAECTADAGGRAPLGVGLGAGDEYYGPQTLEERIAGADAIVRVRLLSVSPASERRAGRNGHYAALEYRFQALEYLQGSGGGELVAVADDPGRTYNRVQHACAYAEEIRKMRDTSWDDREAIVFLRDNVQGLPSTQQADRYWFGAVSLHWNGAYFWIEDYFTISSRHAKRWLPAASSGNGGGASGASGGGEQRFLLDAPASGGAGGASGQAESAPTITLTEMKAEIAEIERLVTAGGGSEAYRDCLHLKYEWERKVLYAKEEMGGVYYHIRYDETVGSGLAAETLAHTSVHSYHALQEYGEEPPTDNSWGEFLIAGRDKDLFHPRWTGVAATARPLPAGVYQFYWGYRHQPYIICDAYPEDELKRLEVFVTVAAPAGTVHEAFFDPATIGTAVGADSSNGVLKPAEFTVGGTATTMQGLKWENGSVTLTLSPYTALTGVAIDFIALDGSVTFSLHSNDATADAAAGTLTWTVAAAPWQAGDKLMLRIREGTPTSTLMSIDDAEA